MDGRQRDGEVRVALVRDEHNRSRFGDGHVRAADADHGLDEFLAQGKARVVLDGLDGRFGAKDPRRVFLGEVDGRGDDVRGAGARELDHALAQVCLDDLHP